MKQVLLVRHAESENNAIHARIVAEMPEASPERRARMERERASDPSLSALGREQARLLADAMARRMQDRRPLLITSPMQRALCTAGEVASAIQIDRDRFWCHGEIYEIGGSYHGATAQPTTTAREIESQFRVTCHRLPPEGWYAGRNGRETADEARQRVDRAIAWMEALLGREDPAFDTIVVVTHGEFMTRWMRRWLGVAWSKHLAFVHGNTGITALIWDARRGILVDTLNDVGHLPDHLRTDVQETWWRLAAPEVDIARHVSQ